MYVRPGGRILNSMKIHARTERLVLRDWTPGDVEPYAALAADPDVMQYIGNGQPRSREYAEDFVAEQIHHQKTRGWMRFVVEEAASGLFAGFCGLDDKTGRLDFGWRYAKAFWGRGYGFEAAAAALYVAQNAFGLTRITCQSVLDNPGSIRIMQKMGMSEIGTYVAYGEAVVVYGFPEEWPDGFSVPRE